jgi:hypothetical protein
MKIIKEEKVNKEINKEWKYVFEVEEAGVYLIEITARAKSWWQNLKSFRSFFNDDDLAVIIDDFSFPKLNNKKGLFDGEMSWNGNQLKGLLKTNLFILYFEKGEHYINFSNDKNPFLEDISIFQTGNEFTYIPSKNNTAEYGDRRPWLALALAGFSMSDLKINITTGKNERDDEDAKIIVDGKIQENDAEKSHKNWYWCGKILKGEEGIFNKDIKLDKGIHYIELYADGNPVLNKIEAEINRKNLGELPTVDNPKWTGDWNDDTDEIILARMILGEGESQSKEAKTGIGFTVLNRIKKQKKQWGYTIHEVVLKESQYDSFWNIKTKEKVRDPFHKNVEKSIWEKCYEVAEIVIGGRTEDPTFGATHFHSFKYKKDFPDWATEENFKIKIDKVYFYEPPR